MKRITTYCLLIFLASLIFYGGAGVNLVSYCCSCCEKFGVEALMDAGCCKMHNHSHAEETCASCEDDFQRSCVNKHACGIKRIDFKWISDDDHILDITPVEHELFFSSLLEQLDILNYCNSFYEVLRISGPPVMTCPRTYLSKLTILLI